LSAGSIIYQIDFKQYLITQPYGREQYDK
jgi:hypothetical protein